jgi:acyl-coenzyme A synthetase/AMP-(fatty) acid ligase
MYGPTETTVWSTLERVVPGARITVGHPIANTQVHVVDDRLRLVPVGVPGELCIGGDGVARGYLGRPELTAEKFVDDPFAAGGRSMYRTGDLARWLADGRLELLGRADQQVKVRGFRIELGEIEGMLERHDAVRQAVCSVYDDGAGDKRLVAYLVYEEGADTTPSELRRFLRGELPDYMVPSLFVELPALPLTANGKVDRKALPPPLEPQRQAGERVAPRTEMERLIAGLWRDAVGASDVSVHDNFFDIGGHSLLSMQVIARLEKEIGVRLQPARFVIDSLEQLSAACEQMLARTPAAAAPPSGSRA